MVGASGGIGQAVLAGLKADPRFARTMALSRRCEGSAKLSSEVGSAQARALPRTGTACGLSRNTTSALDLQDESSLRAAARHIATLGVPLRLVMVATGFLHGGGFEPEKALKQLEADHMAKAFAVNVIGPALLMKHLLPLLAPQGKSVFAVLSAKVGSIGDNRLGGWHSYRASKAALNQIVRTAAIELQRRSPESICVALHPGTVATPLSAPFGKAGLAVQTPAECAARLLAVVDGLGAEASGGFFDQHGGALPW